MILNYVFQVTNSCWWSEFEFMKNSDSQWFCLEWWWRRRMNRKRLKLSWLTIKWRCKEPALSLGCRSMIKRWTDDWWSNDGKKNHHCAWGDDPWSRDDQRTNPTRIFFSCGHFNLLLIFIAKNGMWYLSIHFNDLPLFYWIWFFLYSYFFYILISNLVN